MELSYGSERHLTSTHSSSASPVGGPSAAPSAARHSSTRSGCVHAGRTTSSTASPPATSARSAADTAPGAEISRFRRKLRSFASESCRTRSSGSHSHSRCESRSHFA